MERAMELIKKFAKEKRKLIFIGRGESWKGDEGPYLWKRAMNQLYG
jgi:hypothetical protein